ncbi:MAG: hypothetical protein ACYSWU_17290 [Planctomycetota bacterium]|jgi:hypothetical protein
MIDLFEAALEIQQFLLERHWRFCIIGGLAAARWGQPRATQDVGLTLLTGFGNEESYIQEILRRFKARVPNAVHFALQNRVLLIGAANGTPIGVSLEAIPFETRVVERASSFRFAAEVSLITCSAEDLVVLKAFAGREQDWIDVQGVLIAQGRNLDWHYINEHLPQLCELKEDPDTPVRLEQLRKQLKA